MNEIQKIYYAQFFAGLTSAASVTFTLYFLSHGLQQEQVGQLFGFFMISLALLDIPTGGIADIFGHKLSVSIGFFFQAISFLIFFIYPNYFGFTLGMLADALGLALQSGAVSSLMYELLHKERLHDDFQKVTGKASGYFLIASVFASPLGTIMYKSYPRLPYFIAFICFLVSACLIYSVKWEFTKRPHTVTAYITTIMSGIHLTVKNRILMATVIIGMALTLNRLLFNQNISQPYQVSIGVDIAYIGFVAALVSAAQAFISMNAYRLSKKLGKNFSLLLIVILPSFSVIVLSFINTLIAIPFIVLLYMSHTFRDPVLTHISQEEVERDRRSTMASTISFLTSITVGVLLPYWGKGIDIFGIHNILFFLGVFSFLVSIAGYLLFKWSSSRVCHL